MYFIFIWIICIQISGYSRRPPRGHNCFLLNLWLWFCGPTPTFPAPMAVHASNSNQLFSFHFLCSCCHLSFFRCCHCCSYSYSMHFLLFWYVLMLLLSWFWCYRLTLNLNLQLQSIAMCLPMLWWTLSSDLDAFPYHTKRLALCLALFLCAQDTLGDQNNSKW